ncbi:hypothetical protein E7811_03680 [Aliigemmobacter aestuarii]|uniref:Metallo-beta-lactamase domain-containing protein n=1 Tax=Aliigemmobacter aestuarii TaxID=1445661 RepID=A0A4S3MQU5_9RHOB|nr:MBL fold metallo-hydrolase [Gemmobacter aestuarii]THD84838.1 hypothetical protein E7811_03680 [Gemmobacter aestuarii]
MNRRRFLTLSATLSSLGLAGGSLVPRRSNPYYDGPASDHYDGLRFFNPDGIPPRSAGDLMRWWRTRDKARWPETVPLAHPPGRPEARIGDGGLRVTMVGHATMLVQVAGLNILTDPVWSDRASPVGFAGPRRTTPPGIVFDDLPPIDAVLLSHNHYDHLDIPTLARLRAAHDPLLVTPLGNDAIVRAGVPGMRTAAMDWGQALPLGAARLHCLPCHHWSARGTRDRRMALWGAFAIETAGGAVLFVGDTGFDRGRPYRDLPALLGRLRLAILPIGAYEPRWFMEPQHQNPAEAVEGFALSGAAHAIGHHWGTFQLTDEAREDPVTALAAALYSRGIAPERFRALAPAQVWDIPPLA